MEHKTKWKWLTEREVGMPFNMGLHSAVFVLEKAENLSPEGRKCLIDELKKNIAEGGGSYTPYLGEYISCNNINPLSIDEICEYLGINRDTFYKLIEINNISDYLSIFEDDMI